MAREQIGQFNWTSYNQLIEHKLNMDELIYVISPVDLPLLTGAGSNGLAVLPRVPVLNRDYKWMDEDVPLPHGSLNGALTNVATAVIVQDDTAVNFPVGSSLLVNDELMEVTAINAATHTLTVVRGVNGTTATTHADGDAVMSIGTSLAEGSVGEAAYRGRDKYTGYTQVFSRKINVTGTEQIIPKYGVPSELARQIVNVGQLLNTEIENAALYGVLYNNATTKKRSTGGLKHYLGTTNQDSTNTWVTVERLQSRQQAAYDQGGMFDILLTRPVNFQALNNVAGNERVRTEYVDTRRGRATVQLVDTEFGTVQLVRDRWCRASDAWCYSRENFVMRVMRPQVLQPLAKTDDTDTFLLVGECGFQVKGPEHCASFSALDATQALPTSGLV